MDSTNNESNTETQFCKGGVMWRNWVLPFIITLVVLIIVRVTFSFLPENILYNDFLAGWIGAMAWFFSRDFYAT